MTETFAGVVAPPQTLVAGATTVNLAPTLAPLTAAQLAAAIAAGLITKTCTVAQTDVGNPFTCTITFLAPVAGPLAVAVTGGVAPTVTFGATGGATATAGATAGGTVTTTVNGPGGVIPAGATVTETITANAAGAITETIGGVAIGNPLLVGTAGVAVGPSDLRKECRPTVPDGVPIPLIQVRVGQTITCVVTVVFPAGTTVTPTPATVTLSNFADFVNTGTSTATFTCAPRGAVAPLECTFTETIAPEIACEVIAEDITVAGTTFRNVLVARQFNFGPLTFVDPIEVLPKAGGTCGNVVADDVLSDANKICTPNVEPQLSGLGVLNCDLFIRTETGVAAGPIPGGTHIDVVLEGPAIIRLDPVTGQRDVLVVSGCNGAQIARTGDEPTTATFFRIDIPAGGCPIGTTIQVSQKIQCATPGVNITPGSLRERIRLDDEFENDIGEEVVAIFTGPGGQPLNLPCPTGPAATATKTCAPIVNGVPPATSTQAFTRVGQTVTCTVTITSPTGLNPAGNVTVTLTNASFTGTGITTGGVVPNPTTLGGNVATIPCVATGATTCSFTETFVPTVACTTIGQTISSIAGGLFAPGTFVFNPITLGPSTANVAGTGATIYVLPKAGEGVVCPGQAVAFEGPAALLLSCTSAPAGTTVAAPIVGQLGVAGQLSTAPLAVGILPAAVPCTVEVLVPCGSPNAVAGAACSGGLVRGFAAPGTIEVSSLAGSLLSLSGTLTTNLRIPCGLGTEINFNVAAETGFVVDPNFCRGVNFSVLGTGVGTVELRARYEPATLPASLGIEEVETSGFVSFVAPATGVSLALNPNPAAVGQTGTATATLFSNFTSAVACGSTSTTVTAAGATATTTTVVPCIDPATGTTITANPGSFLNGIVVFTIEDTAIARFTDVGLTTSGTVATAGTTLGIGVTATANQVIRNCGAFTGGLAMAIPILSGGQVSTLAPFFGGCRSASATYVGVNPGAANVAATFIPFLPGASNFQSALTGVSTTTLGAGGVGIGGINFFSPNIGPASTFQVLQVAGAAAATTMNLVAGCNNVVAPANETVAQVAARVTGTTVYSVFRQVPGTTQFQGAPVGQSVPAGVANLTDVRALDAIFICVQGSGTYRLA